MEPRIVLKLDTILMVSPHPFREDILDKLGVRDNIYNELFVCNIHIHIFVHLQLLLILVSTGMSFENTNTLISSRSPLGFCNLRDI